MNRIPPGERVLSALMGLFFLAFCLPKLLGIQVSVELFDTINGFLGWHGPQFRYFVGIMELSVGALLFTATLMNKERGPWRGKFGIYLLALVATVGTMLGALFTELIIRPGEDLALTILAAVILILSIYLIWRNRNYLPFVGKPPATAIS